MGFRFSTPVTASFGEEEFFLDRDLNDFKDQPNRNVVLLDGSAISDAELASICATLIVDFDDPANTKPRAIVVDNAHKFKPEKAMKAYLDGKGPRDLGSVLALIVRDDKPLAFWSKLGDKATFREHKKLKTFDNNNEVVKWIQEEAKRLKLVVDYRTASIMFHAGGGDLYRLSNELQKLRLILEAGTTVTLDHLKLVMTPGSNAEPWTVSDAAFDKNTKKALNSLSSLYKYVADDPAMPVLYSMMRQAEKLFVTRTLLDAGVAHDDIAARLGVHPYKFKLTLLQQAGKHSKRKLASVMQNLCRLDVDLKRTSHSKRTLLELAILDLAS